MGRDFTQAVKEVLKEKAKERGLLVIIFRENLDENVFSGDSLRIDRSGVVHTFRGDV